MVSMPSMPSIPTMPGSWDLSPSPYTTPALEAPNTHTYVTTQLLSRRREFLSPKTVTVQVSTWNIGSFESAHDLPEWLPKVSKSPEQVDIYALALQEVVDVTNTQNFLRYIDPKIALSWKAHAQNALPAGYECVASTQLIGMLLMVFVSPRIADSTTNVSVSNVGTGLMGYVGNKGGVGVRIVLGDTLRLVFVNCHLAAFTNATDRRNWDAAEISRRLVFDPVTKETVGLNESTALPKYEQEGLDKSDIVFWTGDLNYRIELDNADVRSLLKPWMPKDLPPTHADISTPPSPIVGRNESKEKEKDEKDGKNGKEEPHLPPTPSEMHPAAAMTLEGTIDSLMRHDQLLKVRREGNPAWNDFKEGKVTFLPTYKYDQGTVGVFDSSEKARVPAWCDRILWRLRAPLPVADGAGTSKPQVPDKNAEMLFEAVDSEEEDEEEDDLIVTRGDTPSPVRTSLDTQRPYDDPVSSYTTPFGPITVSQLSYVSHQHITTSDHKPVSSLFSLTFPASVPAQRTTIHAEIVREADKMENEHRPVITVLIDSPTNEISSSENHALDFGNIAALRIYELTLTVANTGTSIAHTSFVDPPKKEYLTIEPLPAKALQPGETASASIRLHVNTPELARKFNSGEEKLDDVVVLHTKDGKDTFLPLTATWQPTTFGTPISELLHVPESSGGYRAWAAQSEDQKQGNARYSSPRELYRLTEHIIGVLPSCTAQGHPNPFARSQQLATVEQSNDVLATWEALDTDTPFPAETTAEAAITVLEQWFRALPDALVDWDTVPAAAKKKGSAVLESLDKEAVNIVVYMTAVW
ncbi:DNase I-like protein [Ascodesmis nigricans]|uniref:DNase I-like protein n=1 Tax=Ascodesmis nigricans TaxID=341454 RepID=A0A4S2N3H9_9PEZI|nr:DNase I-like protein [Ascodesmis nigricans]